MSDTSDEKNTGFRFDKLLMHVVLDSSSAAHHLLTYLFLAARNDSGTSYHSQLSLSLHTGMEVKTIRRATNELKDLGLIACEYQGRGHNILYTVHHAKLVEVAEAGKTRCAERSKVKQAGYSVG